jgi:hypothetical protein
VKALIALEDVRAALTVHGKRRAVEVPGNFGTMAPDFIVVSRR